jgi:hypothetical protein
LNPFPPGRHQGPGEPHDATESDLSTRRYTFVAFAALALQSACGPAAAGWSSFNPPVGSRWIVETETKTDDVRSLGHRTALIRSRAEMTIDGKTADGFNVTYVLRGATTEGNDPSLPLLRSAMQALGDIPIHATTDERGKPIRLDNPGRPRRPLAAWSTK